MLKVYGNQHCLQQTPTPLLKVYVLYTCENVDIFGWFLSGNDMT